MRPVGGEAASASAESSESPPSAEKEDDRKDDKESDGEQPNEPTQSGWVIFHRRNVECSRLSRETYPPRLIIDWFSQTGGCPGLGPTFRLFCRRKTMRISTKIEMTEFRHRRSIYYANHNKSRTCVHTYIISKRIELESPCWSGFEAFQIYFKTCATGAF